jgi:transcriptional regulator GlxA family with amidase domain
MNIVTSFPAEAEASESPGSCNDVFDYPAMNSEAAPPRVTTAGDDRLDSPFPHRTAVLVVVVAAVPEQNAGGEKTDRGLGRTNGLNKRALRQITDYMRDHLSEDITLDELAAEVHISKYHLLRQFTKSTGLTPHRYLTALRISRAATLLVTTDGSVLHIAQACGYRSPSRFAATFRRQYGTTPTRFRQQMGH